MQISVKEPGPRAAAMETKRRTGTSALWTYVVAGLLALFYFVTSIQIAAHRFFWFDELFTLYIARLPHVSTIWSALGNGVDALPPAYYVVVRLFDSLFGPGDIAARIPSMLAMAIGLCVIFDCARRLTDGLHGLIALSVATCSFLPYYGFEARSYGVYFMFAALALWAWTNESLSRNAQAVLFGLSFFGGECFHYYFGMCLLPFVLWELLRWKPGHRPSLKILAGLLGGVTPVVIFSPLILSFSRKFAGGYWNRPSFPELRAIFSQLFPDGLFLLSLIMIWIVLSRHDEEKEIVLEPMPSAEVIGWLSLAIPFGGLCGLDEDERFLQPLLHWRAAWSRCSVCSFHVASFPSRVSSLHGSLRASGWLGRRAAADHRASSRSSRGHRNPSISRGRGFSACGRETLLRFFRADVVP